MTTTYVAPPDTMPLELVHHDSSRSKWGFESHELFVITGVCTLGLLIALVALCITQIPTHHASVFVPLDGVCQRVDLAYPEGSFSSPQEAWAHRQNLPLNAVDHC